MQMHLMNTLKKWIWSPLKYKMSSTFPIYKYGKKIREIKIEKDDIVLDIGAGHNPFIRADVLVDKYVDTPKHRSSGRLLKIDSRQILIIGDAEILPFKDNSFDFVVCRHVLEHVDNPQLLLKELKRIGKKGYIETPSPFRELIHGGIPNQKDLAKIKGINELIHGEGHEGHVRFAVSNGERIITCEKTEDELMIYLMFGYYLKNNTDYEIEKFRNRHPFWNTTTHVWNSSSQLKFKNLKVNYEKRIKFTENYNLEQQIQNLRQLSSKNVDISIGNTIKKLIRKHFYGHTNRHFDIYEKIACPVCKGGLKKLSNSLICESCDYKFPIVCGVPILVKEAINKEF